MLQSALADIAPVNYYSHLSFPAYGNLRWRDCFYAAAAHAYGSLTGNSGTECIFNRKALVASYLKLSRGNQGLTANEMFTEWHGKGLVGNSNAVCYASMSVDPANQQQMQASIRDFGGVILTLDVPDRWYRNWHTGMVWDKASGPDSFNAHAVWIDGVDAKGRYHVETWSGNAWLTQRGISRCDPAAIAVFCPALFSPSTGLSPTGATYDQAVNTWVSDGGSDPVPSGSL